MIDEAGLSRTVERTFALDENEAQLSSGDEDGSTVTARTDRPVDRADEGGFPTWVAMSMLLVAVGLGACAAILMRRN